MNNLIQNCDASQPIVETFSNTSLPTCHSHRIDDREQLVNSCLCGPIHHVSMAEAAITSLHGILLDFDPCRLHVDVAEPLVRASPERLHHEVVRPWLNRHHVFARAEIRSSGRGLHGIVRMSPPVEFATAAQRTKWAAAVKIIQKLLPTDPDCPGITALTRPLGSYNSKNDKEVHQIYKGEPVSPLEMLELCGQAVNRPFATVAGLLYPSNRISPCPVCLADGSHLDVLDNLGTCYGGCGKVRIGQIMDRFLCPRPAKKGGCVMARSRTAMSIGDEQESHLLAAIKKFVSSPLDGARDLPVLTGLRVPPKAVYTEPQDNVILKTIEFLVASGKIYLYGSDVVFEADSHNGHGESLHPLRAGGEVKTGASRLLANIFVCQDGETQFPPPIWFVGVLLASTLLSTLPRIKMYANRPVFDANFQLCAHGWHPESGVLVHGPCIDPVLYERADPALPALERLPPHLRSLLSGFCFRSDADLANAVSMFLTGLLANHFIEAPKGLFLLDGNQPGLGKTLLARCVGFVLDGFEPRLINYLNNEEELEKRICATLRGRPQSIVLIDNAKASNSAAISSQVVEANSVAPEISLRVLGKSENFTCPNDKLWAITMNDTRVSPDMVSRGAPVRMEHEGRPEDRLFIGPAPIEYIREHHQEILGELAGMVIRWNQAGRPGGDRSHRSYEWASVVGGILKVAGLPEFLENASEAAASFNDRLVDLAALAEAVVAQGGPYIVVPTQE